MKTEAGGLGSLEFRFGTQTLMATFQEVSRDLEAFLQRMIESDGQWVLLLEIEQNSLHYVQLLTDREEETLLAECVSNEYLQGSDRLTERQEELLPTVGWGWPAPPNERNWFTIEFNSSSSLETAIRIVHTLRRVFECSDETVLKVAFFPGARWKITPRDRVEIKPELKEPTDLGDQLFVENFTMYRVNRDQTFDVQPLENLGAFEVVDGGDWSSHPLLKLIESASDYDGLQSYLVECGDSQQMEFFETLTIQFRYEDRGWISAGPGIPGRGKYFPAKHFIRIDYEWPYPFLFLFPLERRALIPRTEAPYLSVKANLKTLTDEQFVEAMNVEKRSSRWVDGQGFYLKYLREEIRHRGILFSEDYWDSAYDVNRPFVLEGKVLELSGSQIEKLQ